MHKVHSRDMRNKLIVACLHYLQITDQPFVAKEKCVGILNKCITIIHQTVAVKKQCTLWFLLFWENIAKQPCFCMFPFAMRILSKASHFTTKLLICIQESDYKKRKVRNIKNNCLRFRSINNPRKVRILLSEFKLTAEPKSMDRSDCS